MSNNDYLYMQIYKDLLKGIGEGLYREGQKLPTEKELSKDYNVSRITCQKAMNLLVEDGIVVRHPGIGSIVAGTKEEDDNIEGNKEVEITEEEIVINKGKKKIIGIVVEALWSCFGIEIFDGAYEMAEKLNYEIIIKKSFGNQEKEIKAIEDLTALGAEGIIVMPVHGDYYNDTILKLVVEKYPIVFLDRYLKGIHVPYVGTDNFTAAKTSVEYLLNKGHKEIALVTAEDNQATTLDERKKGYIDGLLSSGVAAKRKNIYDNLSIVIPEKDHDEILRKEVINLKGFFEENSEVTAVLATEYHMAKIAEMALKQLGKEVPRDIEIVCFDCPKSYFDDNEFTSIIQNEYEMGKKSVEVLNKLIKEAVFVANVTVEADLIKGKSTL